MKTSLTADELARFVSAYPATKNADLQAEFDISRHTLHRLAGEHGLTKTREFMLEQHRANFHKADLINRANGYAIQRKHIAKMRADGKASGFPKGYRMKDTMTPEQWAERNEKMRKAMKEHWESDRKRVRWGLEQRTKLRVCDADRSKVAARHRLTKLYGYKFDRSGRVGYYNADTKRNLALENKYADKYRFRYEFKDF